MAKSKSKSTHPHSQNHLRSSSRTQAQDSQNLSLVTPSWWKFASGLLLIILGVILVITPIYLKRLIENNALSQDFSSEPVKIDPSSFAKYQLSDPPLHITIPDLEIDLPVKTSPIRNGYWVVWEDAAGFGEGSAPPGQAGNTVIFAHARAGLFLPLKQAEKGMQIQVLTDSDSYNYQIVDIKTVLPFEVEVIAPTEDQTLTLYTCSGFLDKKRLIVVAKPV